MTKRIQQEVVTTFRAEGLSGMTAQIGALNNKIGVLKTAAENAFQAAQGFVSLAKAGQEAAALDKSFRQLGGSAKSLEALKRATKNLIPDSQLKKMANTATLLGVNADKLDQFAQIAVGASQATGESVEHMFQSLVTGIARGSAQIIDNLGIQVKVADANTNMATRLGIATSALTDAQKKAAFEAEVLNKAQRQLALGAGAQVSSIAQLETQWANLKGQLGGALARILDATHITKILSNLFKALGPILDVVAKTFEAVTWPLGKVIEGFGWLTDQIGSLFGEEVELEAQTKATGAALGAAAARADQLGNASGTAAGKVKKLEDRLSKAKMAADSFAFLTDERGQLAREQGATAALGLGSGGDLGLEGARLAEQIVASTKSAGLEGDAALDEAFNKLEDIQTTFEDGLNRRMGAISLAMADANSIQKQILQNELDTLEALRAGGLVSSAAAQDEIERMLEVHDEVQTSIKSTTTAVKQDIGDLRGFIEDLENQIAFNRAVSGAGEGGFLARLFPPADTEAAANAVRTFGAAFLPLVENIRGLGEALDGPAWRFFAGEEGGSPRDHWAEIAEGIMLAADAADNLVASADQLAGDSLTRALTGIYAMTDAFADMFDQLVAVADAQDTATQASLGVEFALQAASRVTGALIKDKQKLAAVQAAFEGAMAIAAFARLDFINGAKHTLAAVKFGLVAGGAGASNSSSAKGAGSSGGRSARTQNRSQRTALSQPRRRSRGRSVSHTTQNVFYQFGDGGTGKALVNAMNAHAKRNDGTYLNPRLTGRRRGLPGV